MGPIFKRLLQSGVRRARAADVWWSYALDAGSDRDSKSTLSFCWYEPRDWLNL